MENFLKLNTLVEGDDYRMERKLVWLYLWLLIFEGALRKWVLPGLNQPLLLVREPIVIFLVLHALQGHWFKSPLVNVMMFVSSISLIMTLFVGHHNALVGLFGWRIYFFHFPFMFVMGHVLTRDDLMKMIRFILLLSIPMTILVVLQFYSPQTAWVNRGIGGDMEGAGFSGALGYSRPPGTFSFTSGYVAYQGVVCCLLLYYLVSNNKLEDKYRFSTRFLYIIVACFLISIPTSISRGLLLQTFVFLLFIVIASLRKDFLKPKIFRMGALVVMVFVVLVSSGLLDTQIEAFMHRFESANQSEGGLAEGVVGNRYIGGLARGFSKSIDMPIWGYGIGLGTNAGSKLMGGNMYSFGFNAENEWERVTGECGLIFGIVIILLRLLFSISCLKKAYNCLINNDDVLPWLLSCGVLLNIPQGQWGIPTNLGFCMLFGGFALVAINTSDEDEDDEEDSEEQKEEC